MAEAAGASVIAVHGRTRAQKGNNPGRIMQTYMIMQTHMYVDASRKAQQMVMHA
jgi:tRNA-dihydrouridine synthase